MNIIFVKLNVILDNKKTFNLFTTKLLCHSNYLNGIKNIFRLELLAREHQLCIKQHISRWRMASTLEGINESLIISIKRNFITS